MAAHAQLSVTLYGILDSGVEYVTHAAKQGSGTLFRLNTGNRINWSDILPLGLHK